MTRRSSERLRPAADDTRHRDRQHELSFACGHVVQSLFEQLRKSGAPLHVVAVVGSQLRSTAPVGRSGDLLHENMSLNQVLGDGPKRSGGRREEVPALAGAVTGLHQLAESLKQQYAIEYQASRKA